MKLTKKNFFFLVITLQCFHLILELKVSCLELDFTVFCWGPLAISGFNLFCSLITRQVIQLASVNFISPLPLIVLFYCFAVLCVSGSHCCAFGHAARFCSIFSLSPSLSIFRKQFCQHRYEASLFPTLFFPRIFLISSSSYESAAILFSLICSILVPAFVCAFVPTCHQMPRGPLHHFG